jgi:transcriptional regulator with XRE-family HTH domain
MLKEQVNYALGHSAYSYSHMETMGSRIRTLRNSKNMSQEELGKIVGISGASISLWESDATRNIRPENFLRFCAFFDVDPYWVCFGAENDPRSNPSNRLRRNIR